MFFFLNRCDSLKAVEKHIANAFVTSDVPCCSYAGRGGCQTKPDLRRSMFSAAV